MPARVRGAGLRQTKSRVPEVPEQETGAAALRVRGFGEERRGEPAVFQIGRPARGRGAGLRQTKSRVPEVPEQETGAAALRVRGFGEERRGEPAVFLGGAGGTLRVVRSRGRAGSLLNARSRLSRLVALSVSHETCMRNYGSEIRSGLINGFQTKRPALRG